MLTFIFFIILLITIQITNKKNEAKATDEVLQFTKSDSLIIVACFGASILINWIAKKFFTQKYWIIIAVASVFLFMILLIVNNNRERAIKQKHETILKIYQALADVLGRVKVEDINWEEIPFVVEEDEKLKMPNKIIIDMTYEGGRFNDNTIILAQYSINKFFSDFQWTSKSDFKNRQLIYKGLPKPPDVAKWPGSDYRPTGWIPLGLNGEGEVGWNIANPKDLGMSSYIMENGHPAPTVKLPSSPQCLTLGSTGGGKAIFVDQIIDIM